PKSRSASKAAPAASNSGDCACMLRSTARPAASSTRREPALRSARRAASTNAFQAAISASGVKACDRYAGAPFNNVDTSFSDSERQLGIGSDAQQLCAEILLDARQRRVVVRLETQHHHRRGVGRPGQTEA